jgi:hypothetical protein
VIAFAPSLIRIKDEISHLGQLFFSQGLYMQRNGMLVDGIVFEGQQTS